MIIKIFKSFDEELENIWNKCKTDSNSTIFQEYNWLLNWYNSFGKYFKTKLCITAIYKEENIICIMPLCINTKKNIKILEWIGGGVSDYHLPIIKDLKENEKLDYNLIFKNLLSKNFDIDLIQLTNQPEKIHNIKNPLVKFFKNELISTSYHIDVNMQWDNFIKENKSVKKQLRDLKRLERNLGAKGSLDYIEYSSIKEKIKVTKEMIFLKEKQYNVSGVKNIFNNKTFQDFYLNLLECQSFNKYMHISSLSLDGDTIAVHYGLKDQFSYYYLMPAYSESWKTFSPGAILMQKLIKSSFEKFPFKFDFLPGNETYKIKWSNKKIGIYEYNQPISMKGYLYFIFLKIRNYLRKSDKIKNIIYFIKRRYNNYRGNLN